MSGSDVDRASAHAKQLKQKFRKRDDNGEGFIHQLQKGGKSMSGLSDYKTSSLASRTEIEKDKEPHVESSLK